MALTSAAALVTATAMVLMAAATLQLAAPATPAAPIGLPGCKTTCGNVSVPYPFGIQPGCYRPGFNLTCDTSRGSPRLLLGDGTLQVVDIYPQNSTVRVLRDGSMVKGADNIASGGLNITFASIFAGGPYSVATFNNELVLFGCEVLATLVTGTKRFAVDKGGSNKVSCASFCSSGGSSFGGDGKYCSAKGCCQASLDETDWFHMPTELHLWPLESRKNSAWDSHVSVFLAEQGWLEMWGKEINHPDDSEPKNDIPLILRWDLMQGLALSESEEKKRDPSVYECPRDVANLCKSNNSVCSADFEVYNCECVEGYHGNPYVPGGCQDITECDDPESNGCFGDCANMVGSLDCRCPIGTYGDPTVRGGCVKTTTATDSGMVLAQIGLPNCNTTCGDVRVPYPFGFGSTRCYLPGFGLTCDASHNPPRLLLGGNSSLQVIHVSLNDSTVRVIHTSTFDVTTSPSEVYDSRGVLQYETVEEQVGVRFPDIGGPYMLSARNEFILTGCNVEATLIGEYKNTTDGIISSCTSNCSSNFIGYSADGSIPRHTGNEYCSGRDGCCHAHIPPGSRPKKVEFKLQSIQNNGSAELFALPPLAFVAEEGQMDQWYMIFNMSTANYFDAGGSISKSTANRHMASQVPLVLQWAVKQEVRTSIQSDCRLVNGSYSCQCKVGFYGNPYVIDGCQDIDECKIPTIRNSCFGNCNNLPGSHECQCPQGTHGNPYNPNGCVKNITGLTIGLLVAIGPAFLLLVLGVTLAIHRFRQHQIKLLKQMHFEQNRGQLLQQLVSQRADIAERMIIPIDELAKATNNFDKARELGGGGHGTVYKGILSDEHVVAIKKSKITVQKEINEFINEVAILSQVNHRNVVKLLGCCLETEVPLLVYEFISNGTLYHHLHIDGPVSLSWSNRLRIATETANALAYLHSSVSIPVIHRDIKSTNILLDDTLTSKVSDFGASRYIPVDKTGLTTVVQGTIGYLDPMCFCTGRLNEKSDVYSFGVILVELLTRKKPFLYPSPDGDGLVIYFAKLHAEGNLDEIIDPQVKEEGGKEVEEFATLAASCIKLSGDDRPTMRQVEHTLEGLQASLN